MAKGKSTKPVTPPSGGDVERVLYHLCRYQQEEQQASRPMLNGPTGSGKTAMAYRVAETLGLPVKTLLLGSALPEDIGGLPKDVPKKDYYAFKIMQELHECIDTPHVLFLDEFDKVKTETLGVALTLLWEKKIRNVYLHPKTVIIGAMQPVNPSIWLADETGKAISARLTHLPIPYKWSYIENKYSISLPHLHERERSKTITLPVMEASLRTVDCVMSFLRSSHGLQLSKEEKRMVLYGTLAQQDAEVLENTLNQTLAWVDPVAIARIDPLTAVETLDVHTLTQHVGPLMEVLTPPAWQRLLEKIWIDGTESDAEATLKNAFEYCKGKCESSPDKGYEFFGTATAEEIVKATSDASTTVAKVWKERETAKAKKE